ncbi:alpha/beta fold hydrolase [Extibacter muris]|nr:alpha/beta hydrolase [Extibacter muris]MCU0080198.1 alpha/beta hydrolase [Extibacter muris]
MTKILIHGSGHKATSWNETISYMTSNEDVMCPDLFAILEEKEIFYANLYSSFIKYCDGIEGKIHLCGISLGGILALNYALDFPQKVKTLVLIGTPHKIPKVAFGIQNVIFRFLPKSIFETMAFDKKGTFALGNSMKDLDFTGRVNNVKCPALIICGKKDSANIKSAYYLSKNIKSAELKIIENTGHVVNEETPKTLARILTEYYSLND